MGARTKIKLNMSDDLQTIRIYPELCHEEDLTPDCGVEIDETVEEIHGAMKGWGSDKGRLIASLGSTTPEDRVKIAIRYKDTYDKDLVDAIDDETGGDFGEAMEFLAMDPVQAECKMIKKSCKGIGSDATLLSSILCGRSNRDMELLKKTYYKMYTEDLAGKIGDELNGDNWVIASSCLQAAEEPYDPDYHTQEKAGEDVEKIYETGQGKWFGTDEKEMFKVIALSPPEYLKLVNFEYADKYGYTLVKAVEEELGGNAEQSALFALKMKLKPYEVIAELIKSACAGIGTDELLLSCCIILYQDVLAHVNFAHEELFGKSIQDRIKDECGGNHRDLLLALINKVCPEE